MILALLAAHTSRTMERGGITSTSTSGEKSLAFSEELHEYTSRMDAAKTEEEKSEISLAGIQRAKEMYDYLEIESDLKRIKKQRLVEKHNNPFFKLDKFADPQMEQEEELAQMRPEDFWAEAPQGMSLLDCFNALYTNAIPNWLQSMGAKKTGANSAQEALELLKKSGSVSYCDYVNGKLMKTSLADFPYVHSRRYDEEYGPKAAQRALNEYHQNERELDDQNNTAFLNWLEGLPKNTKECYLRNLGYEIEDGEIKRIDYSRFFVSEDD